MTENDPSSLNFTMNGTFERAIAVDDKFHIILNDNMKQVLYETDVDGLLDYFGGPKNFHEIFSDFMGYENDCYLVNGDKSMKIKLDIANVEMLGKLGIRFEYSELFNRYNTTIMDIVPDELKNDYCLIFGGKVMFHSKDLNEMIRFRDSVGLSFTEYYPQSNQ